MSPFLPPKVSVPLSISAQPSQSPSKKHRNRKHSPSDIHKPSSIRSWVKQILPAHRPERRGTFRRRGYWDQEELKHPDEHKSRRQLPQPRRSPTGATSVPDHTVGRNMATNIPPGGQLHSHPDSSSTTYVDKGWGWDLRDDGKHHQRSDTEKKRTLATKSGSQSLPTREFQHIQVKQDARRLRRNLKESGDYLGVQGFNPETGQLDILTPSDSDRSSLSQETQQKLLVLKNTLKGARHSYKTAKERSEREAKKVIPKNDKQKLLHVEKGNEQAQDINKTVKWKRHARQWSSAQEPNLSPIAQSVLRVEAGSRRESKIGESTIGRRDSEFSLIDLTVADKDDAPSHVASGGVDQFGKSPESTATIVRTPRRKSIAELEQMGPSAWELFVNGISFDNSDESKPQENHNCGTQLTVTIKHCPDTEHEVAHARKNEESPMVDTETINVIAEQQTESFLGMDIGKANDHKGKAPARSCHQVGIPPAKTEEHLVHTASPGKKLMKNWGQWMSKRRQSRSSHTYGAGIMNTKTTTATEQYPEARPVICLESIPKVSDNWGIEVTSKLAQHAPASPSKATLEIPVVGAAPKIEEMPEARGDVLDRITTKRHIEVRGNCEKRHNSGAVVSRVRGIDLPAPAESASTHIITTTGSDRHLPKAKFRAKVGQEIEKPQIHMPADQITEVIYDLPLATMSERNLGSSVIRILPNSLPRTKPVNNDIDIASTLKCKPKARLIKPPLKKNMMPLKDFDGARRWDTPMFRPKSQAKKEEGTEVISRGQNVDCMPEATTEKIVSKKKRPSGMTEAVQHVQDVEDIKAVTAAKEKESPDMFVTDEVTQLVRAPGRFPDLNIVGDAGHGCQSSLGDVASTTTHEDIAKGHSWDAGQECLELVWCHLLAFIFLYWERVSPFFHSKSEYWTRQSRSEGTLDDCFTLVLAAPLTLALLAVYILVLRLALMCAENFAVFTERMDSVYRYVMDYWWYFTSLAHEYCA
ncbi:hypothetical protein QQS21_000675 [Conoideocrella luteorostrata]|uniref:Uncharacterized protein n=1 Tax=Conoideocrella luteorostrata TaxID=1105319 RepID=A0AAJ0G3X1_9HYPO|nr:hypothetical protein QQS21_000675 [Conoideocrella luteorostrata]